MSKTLVQAGLYSLSVTSVRQCKLMIINKYRAIRCDMSDMSHQRSMMHRKYDERRQYAQELMGDQKCGKVTTQECIGNMIKDERRQYAQEMMGDQECGKVTAWGLIK